MHNSNTEQKEITPNVTCRQMSSADFNSKSSMERGKGEPKVIQGQGL